MEIPGYESIREIGTGGMGIVFEVRCLATGRSEALKLIKPKLSMDEEIRERFSREMKFLAACSHPNIVTLYHAAYVRNSLYYTMELLPGPSLTACIRSGAVEPADALRYAGQIAYALSYIHGRNGIHRDIKPSNILLAASRTPKLLDFGIMKCLDQSDLTRSNETLGSVPYMSPEQVKGLELTPYADVYSLGVLFFELLTGLRPFTGSDYFIQDAHLKTPPPRPSSLNPVIPPQLDEITVAMLAKNAKDRPSAKDVGDELNRLLVLYDEPPTTRTLRADPVATKITREDVNDAEVWLKANGSGDIARDFDLYLAEAEVLLEHGMWDRAVRRFGGCLWLLNMHWDVLGEAPITCAREQRAKIYTGRGKALIASGRVEEGIANFLIADEAFRWLRLWDSVRSGSDGELAKLFGNRYGTDKTTIVAGLLRMYHSSILNDAFSSKDPL